jgi:hypothetical protein
MSRSVCNHWIDFKSGFPDYTEYIIFMAQERRFVEAIITTPMGYEEHIPMAESMAERLESTEADKLPVVLSTTGGRMIPVESIRIERPELYKPQE